MCKYVTKKNSLSTYNNINSHDKPYYPASYINRYKPDEYESQY